MDASSLLESMEHNEAASTALQYLIADTMLITEESPSDNHSDGVNNLGSRRDITVPASSACSETSRQASVPPPGRLDRGPERTLGAPPTFKHGYQSIEPSMSRTCLNPTATRYEVCL